MQNQSADIQCVSLKNINIGEANKKTEMKFMRSRLKQTRRRRQSGRLAIEQPSTLTFSSFAPPHKDNDAPRRRPSLSHRDKTPSLKERLEANTNIGR